MNDTFLMWVEDGVIEFDYFAKNSYEYPRFDNQNLNKTKDWSMVKNVISPDSR